MVAQKTEIPPSRWWTVMARPAVRDYPHGYVALSKELAKKVGRAKPWAHTALVRFIANGQCSDDLATAISAFFKLPRPAFLARSVKEAFAMEAVASQFDNAPPSEIEADIVELRELLAERERELEAATLKAAGRAAPSRARRHG